MAKKEQSKVGLLFLLAGIGVAAFAISSSSKKDEPIGCSPEGNTETQTRNLDCGLNNNGTQQQQRTRSCVGGVFSEYSDWINVGGCINSDVCTNGDTQTITCPDGSVIITQNCTGGQWQNTGNTCPPILNCDMNIVSSSELTIGVEFDAQGDLPAEVQVDWASNGTSVQNFQVPISTTHTYPASGTYQVTADFIGANGTSCRRVSNVTVTSTPPPNLVCSLSVISFDTSTNTVGISADATGDPNELIDINWDDGQFTRNVGPGNYLHQYSSGGNYTITLTARGGSGATCTKTRSITVTECSPNGIRQCNGNNVEQCQDGLWVGIQSCSEGCSGGSCNPPSVSCNISVLSQDLNDVWFRITLSGGSGLYDLVIDWDDPNPNTIRSVSGSIDLQHIFPPVSVTRNVILSVFQSGILVCDDFVNVNIG